MCHRKRSLKKVTAIVQARLGSSRLPLKSLASLCGLPLIDWVTQRLAKASEIDKIIVAIPDTQLDGVLAKHLAAQNVEYVSGPEHDVLKRFQLAAEFAGGDIIVRVCADNPFIWWDAVDQVIRFYKSTNFDYAYNHIPRNNLWPDGLGAEVISAQLLKLIDQKAKTSSQREHCLNYIWDNAQKFRIGTFKPHESWLERPDLKFDIDTVADFQRLALLPVYPQIGARELIEAASGTPTDTSHE